MTLTQEEEKDKVVVFLLNLIEADNRCGAIRREPRDFQKDSSEKEAFNFSGQTTHGQNKPRAKQWVFTTGNLKFLLF